MRNQNLTAAAAALALCMPAAPAAAQTALVPGYYEVVTRVAGDPEPDIQHQCLTAAEAKTRTLEVVLAEWTEGRCAFSQRQIGGGKFAFAGSCTLDGSTSTFRHTGAYTPTSFSANLNSRTVVSGQPLDVKITTSSRRIAAACPARAR